MWAYEDVPQSPPTWTLVHRLESLRAVQRAWGNPLFQVTRKIFKLPFVPDGTRHVVSCSDGTIMFAAPVPVEDSSAMRSRIDFLYLDDILDDTYRNTSPLYLDVEGGWYDVQVDLWQRLLITIEIEGCVPVTFFGRVSLIVIDIQARIYSCAFQESPRLGHPPSSEASDDDFSAFQRRVP